MARPAAGPASALLALFKSFFTLVLLQQIFASVRQGRLLAETIADFWSPHEPIHERARAALPQYGAGALGPLLVSLRSAEALTREQREQLPQILATIGPAAIPDLVAPPRRPERARPGGGRRDPRPAPGDERPAPTGPAGRTTRATWSG